MPIEELSILNSIEPSSLGQGPKRYMIPEVVHQDPEIDLIALYSSFKVMDTPINWIASGSNLGICNGSKNSVQAFYHETPLTCVNYDKILEKCY